MFRQRLRFWGILNAKVVILAKILPELHQSNRFGSELNRFGCNNVFFNFSLKNVPLVSCLKRP